jgi:hypothetical protein
VLENIGEANTSDTNDNKAPVKSIHEFLLEVREEMSRFRVNLLGSVLAWAVIVCSLSWFAIRFVELGEFSSRLIVGSVFLLVAAVAVIYSAYMLYRLNRFFNRWGKRFEHLEGVERELLGE